MNYLLYCLVGIFTLLFLRNVLNWSFAMENYFVHKKRLKQLKFNEKKDVNLSEIINAVGKPTSEYILPRLNIFNENEIKRKLDFIGWNKYFTAESYIAFGITTKIIGVVLFVLMVATNNFLLGLIWGLILMFFLDFLLDNTVDAKKEVIYADFPDFLRVTQGFLSSGMPFLIALEKTLPYINEEWQKLIKNFITDFKIYNVDTALDNLKNATDMFEIKEFVILVKLILEQGGNVKEGFDIQAESIIEMQQFLLEKKIAKRRTLTVAIQAPIMICIFATFGLPIIGDMTSIGLI